MSGVTHVVDYGVGNLYSVARAIEKAGGEARLTSAAAEIARAERLVLPGVGAFRNGMAGLMEAGLDEAVSVFAASGRPLLGICLGMQLLASRSEEFGEHDGLGLIPGSVVPILAERAEGPPRKIPFIGWTRLTPTRGKGFAGTPLADIDAGEAVYLVHSYHFEPDDETDRLASYDYDGFAVTAAVQRGNIFGCQFHPEKSGPTGLRIVADFLAS